MLITKLLQAHSKLALETTFLIKREYYISKESEHCLNVYSTNVSTVKTQQYTSDRQ